MSSYTVPRGVIGLQATCTTWSRLDSGAEPLPPTWSLSDGDMEIRLYRYGLNDLDDLTAAELGIVVLRPGASVPVKDDVTVPVPVAPDLTADPRRRRGRSARRQRPRSR